MSWVFVGAVLGDGYETQSTYAHPAKNGNYMSDNHTWLTWLFTVCSVVYITSWCSRGCWEFNEKFVTGKNIDGQYL